MESREEGEVSEDDRPITPVPEIRSGINQQPPNQEPSTSTNEVFKFLESVMFAQNQSFQKVMSQFAKQQPGQKSIALPEFNPEIRGVDAKAWLSMVDLCLQNELKEGTDMILTLSRAMKGTAAQWFTQVTYPQMTWDEFKGMFLCEYDILDTPASAVLNLLNTSPQGPSNYVAFASRMLSVLNARFSEMSPQEMSVTLVLAHLSKFDKRIFRLAHTSSVMTKDVLMKELNALSYGKRSYEGRENLGQPETKRFRGNPQHSSTSTMTCYYCKRLGHRASECKKRNPIGGTSFPRHDPAKRATFSGNSSSSGIGKPRQGACYTCQSPDHYANACPQRKDGKRGPVSHRPQGRPHEKRVDLCSVNPSGSLTSNGKSFDFTFDSGSECSLLRCKLQDQLLGPIFETPVILKGIGKSEVLCSIQKIIEVVIDGNTLKICFHVVSDDSISHDMIVGREILDMGVQVTINSERCVFVPTDLNLSKSIRKKIGGLENSSENLTPSIPTSDTPNIHDTDFVEIPVENRSVVADELNNVLIEVPEEPLATPPVLTTVFEVESLSHYFDTESDNKPFDPTKIETEIDEKYKPELISILQKYQTYFTEGFPNTTVTTGKLQIRLIDPQKIVSRRPYPLSPTEKQVVREHLKQLEAAGIIRPSKSPFASPIHLVPKKNGKIRMTIDYRLLNANTIAEKQPLPLIRDQLARLAGAQWFITLDMASGYYQIAVHEDSIEYTAFVTPDTQMEFLKMPFGLKNSGRVFQRALLEALGPLAHDYVAVYVDDLLLFAPDIELLLTRLDNVLDILTKTGFYLNPSKCSFVVKRVLYLGYDVSQGQIRPNTQKVDALRNLKPPTNVSSLRQFLGLATYFRQFIPNFSIVATPLYKLLTSKTQMIWTPEHEAARRKLIEHLTNEPVLMIFDPALPIELHCDASSEGFGGILLHKMDNKPRVIAYFSKKTTPAQSRYHSYEQETLAVLESIKHFQTYLQYCFFTVVTDCKSLKESYLKQDLNTRVHRWWSFLQAFNFKIIYRPANLMQHADFLSRNPILSQEQERCTKQTIPHDKSDQQTNSLEISTTTTAEHPSKIPEFQVDITTLPDDWLMLAQRQDPEMTKIIEKLENDSLPEDMRTYEIRSGVLCRHFQRNQRDRCLPIVPHKYKWSVVNNVHSAVMHLGYEKTLEKVADFYWFKHMAKFVKRFVENCITCKVAKTASGKTQVQLHPIPKTAIPWHTVHMDISGKLSGKNDSKEYVIVMVDAFTKYVLLRHTRKLDAINAIKALQFAIVLFGTPTKLIVDQGRSFANKDFKQFCDQNQIEMHFIATGASRANSQVERVMSVITNLLSAAELGERTWQDAMGDVQLAINSTINRVTRSSPLEMLIGKVARPLGLVVPTESVTSTDNINLERVRDVATQNMIVNAKYEKNRFDRTKAKIRPFSKNDLVLIQNEPRNQTKLSPKFKGPFRVIDVLDNDRYTIKSITSNRTYKYPHDRLRSVPNQDPPDMESDFSSTESDPETNIDPSQ